MCMTPFSITKETGSQMPVPCGKCPQCVKRRLTGWAFRLQQQLKVSNEAHFLTITYDNKHIPISSGFLPTLCKSDLQLFFKRLRKAHPKEERIKYYAVGEYGTKTARPHYHCVLFNAHLNKIDPAWQLGNIHYGQVNGASIAYTLKYMQKSKLQRLGGWIYGDVDDDREAPRSLMSKGLGENYLSENMVKWHQQDVLNRSYLTLEGGKKISMPRYYKDKVYQWWEKNMIAEQIIKQMDLQTKQHWNDPMYFHNQNEGYKAAFYKLQRAAEKEDKL